MPARASQDPDRRGITQDGSAQRQLTLQAGLLRSQSRTVASSPAERKPSSCGWTSNERTLSPVSEWLRGIRNAPSRVGFKVADVPVLVHAVISDRVVFLCGCMDQVVRPVGEPRMRDSVFLRIERLELPARVSTRPGHTETVHALALATVPQAEHVVLARCHTPVAHVVEREGGDLVRAMDGILEHLCWFVLLLRCQRCLPACRPP